MSHKQLKHNKIRAAKERFRLNFFNSGRQLFVFGAASGAFGAEENEPKQEQRGTSSLLPFFSAVLLFTVFSCSQRDTSHRFAEYEKRSYKNSN